MSFFRRLLKKNVVKCRSDLEFKRRARAITAAILCVLVLMPMLRIGYIMIAHGDEYREEAQKNQLYDTQIPALRGTIYDRNMNEMVTGATAWMLTASPAGLHSFYKNTVKKAYPESETAWEDAWKEYTKEIGREIGHILGVRIKPIVLNLRKEDKSYVRLQRKIDAKQKNDLDELFSEKHAYGTYVNKKGEQKDLTFKASSFFAFENDTLRMYPENNFASTIIGVTSAEGEGITGVEKYYNAELSGIAGRQVTAKDAHQNPIESGYESVEEPQQGNGLVLTIDENIQYYLENALQNALDATKAKGVYGIVMEPATGAVLAMSDKPDFDLNNPRKLLDKAAVKELKEYKNKPEYNAKLSEKLFEQWDSFCVTSTYEPGSTFKIFTAAAALEEGVADLNTTYTCGGAYQVTPDTLIHCANTRGHGYQTFTQGLMNSCNPFFINLGQKLGVDNFYKYFEAFGFTERTGIDLTGEAMPIVHSHAKMGKVELASTSFGQSFRVSPIQMITAGCAIANGGQLMTPYVVDSIIDSKGNLISKTEPKVRRQAISNGTAATVRQMMEAVVEGGTGKNAYIEGYRVAGKTATSEKLDKRSTGQFLYVASFLCFAPADNPQVAVLVGVDEPPGQYRGGGVLAAPIAKEVLEPTLKYLGVEPQYTESELKSVSKTTPSLIGKTIVDARSKASSQGITLKVIGSGETVLSQVPSAGQSIPEKGVIIAYTEKNARSEKVKVPDFTGMTAAEVNETAVRYGLNVAFSGPYQSAGALVYKQSIATDTEVQAGSRLTVYFQATANMND